MPTWLYVSWYIFVPFSNLTRLHRLHENHQTNFKQFVAQPREDPYLGTSLIAVTASTIQSTIFGTKESTKKHDFWHEGGHQKARFCARGKALKSSFVHEGKHSKQRSSKV